MYNKELGMVRHIPIPTTYNIRDLGRLPTQTGQTTSYNVFWRGDSPHNVPAEARDLLLQHQMTTVIDMRQADECEKYPSPFVHDSMIHYVHIPLLTGRGDALAIATLRDFYVHIVDTRKSALAAVLATCATAPAGVYFHCQLGKDRTGIISALLLLLSGVPEASVIDDYAATTILLHPLVTQLMSTRPAHLSTQEFAELLSSHPDTMHHLITHMSTKYGDIRGYMASTGLASVHIDMLTSKLH